MVKVGSRFQKIFEEAKQHPAYWMEDLRLQFLDDIYEIMQEQKLAQKDLAEKMGVSEAYISKVFNGNVEKNFTLKTLVELSRAVNAEIRITVTPKESEEVDQDYFQPEWENLQHVPQLCNSGKDDTETESLKVEPPQYENPPTPEAA